MIEMKRQIIMRYYFILDGCHGYFKDKIKPNVGDVAGKDISVWNEGTCQCELRDKKVQIFGPSIPALGEVGKSCLSKVVHNGIICNKNVHVLCLHFINFKAL